MAVDNEELMMNLQRASVRLRRSRRAETKNRPNDKDGNPRDFSQGHGAGNRGRHGHRGDALEGPNPHGIGNHKCHGGSGHHGQNRILAVLMMQDGTSQKDLAYLLGIRPQSLTQALDSLEQGGFVTRKQDDQDKRTRRVYLTDAGRARAEEAAEDRKHYAENAFSMLTEDEKEQLAAILEKVNASLDAAHEEAHHQA